MKKVIKDMDEYIPAPHENINLAMNENHHVKWNEVLKENIENVPTTYEFTAYGDNQFEALRTRYAALTNVEPEQIAVVCGSDSVISVLFNSLVEKNILLFEPDFFRFDEIAATLEKQVFKLPIYEGFDVEKTIKLIQKYDIELCIFSSPNNPLGIQLSKAEIERILQETNCYLVVDEAYIEFGTEESVADLINKYPKLLVMRTTSKAWGLAGMRIGFVISNKEMVDYLKKAIGVFNVNTMTTEIVAKAMNHPEIMTENVQQIIKIRDEWQKKLADKYGYKVYPSSTNFINVETPDAFAIWQFLKEHQLNVSKFPPANLRISIGTIAEMAALEQLLDAYVSQK